MASSSQVLTRSDIVVGEDLLASQRVQSGQGDIGDSFRSALQKGFTHEKLLAFASEAGLPVNGTKEELAARIVHHTSVAHVDLDVADFRDLSIPELTLVAIQNGLPVLPLRAGPQIKLYSHFEHMVEPSSDEASVDELLDLLRKDNQSSSPTSKEMRKN
eukprot:1407392-Rhodomonas_salina.1